VIHEVQRDNLHKIYSVVLKAAWILFLVTLPVTSFPYFPPDLGGGTLVRPLAVYPLLVLVVLATIPRLMRNRLPRTLLSFLPFVLAALAGVLLASIRGIEPAQGVSVSSRMLRALITLGLGGAIYFTVVLIPRSAEDLRFALRWLYIGFAAALLWGSLQAIYVIRFSDPYFEFLSNLQGFISIRRLFPGRISGLTYEPNWFAEQITFLLMPWLFAAVLRNRSVFEWRFGRVTNEWLLLLWSGILLVFTYSRTGLFILLVLVFASMVFFISSRGGNAPKNQSSRMKAVLRRLGTAGAVVLVLSALIFLAGTQNNYFSRLWRYWSEDTKTSSYIEYIAFGQRLIYWQTAYNIYAKNPILGVGLGNFAFYFEDNLPYRPFNTIPEVLRIVTSSQGANRLITSKNLYTRLLAETGLVGSATFFVFVIAILGCALYLWLSKDPEANYWGVAGLMGLVAFALTAISTDSFSIPNMWVVFGLITAAAHNSAQSESKSDLHHPGLENGQDDSGSGERKYTLIGEV
jgi:O-antigen ligase